MSGSRQLRHYLFLREQGWSVQAAADEVGMALEEARLTDAARAKGDLADVEPLDPAAPPIGHNNPPEEEPTMSEGNVAAEELRLLIERVERLEEEKKGLSEDIRDVYGEAKALGYDVRTMREMVKLRKLERHVREEREALVETYKAALGMDFAGTPLGTAAVSNAMRKTAEAINSGALGPNVIASFHPAN